MFTLYKVVLKPLTHIFKLPTLLRLIRIHTRLVTGAFRHRMEIRPIQTLHGVHTRRTESARSFQHNSDAGADALCGQEVHCLLLQKVKEK